MHSIWMVVLSMVKFLRGAEGRNYYRESWREAKMTYLSCLPFHVSFSSKEPVFRGFCFSHCFFSLNTSSIWSIFQLSQLVPWLLFFSSVSLPLLSTYLSLFLELFSCAPWKLTFLFESFWVLFFSLYIKSWNFGKLRSCVWFVPIEAREILSCVLRVVCENYAVLIKTKILKQGL